MRSSINELKRVRSISPVAIGTTGTGQTGKIVDRRPTVGGVTYNYRRVAFETRLRHHHGHQCRLHACREGGRCHVGDDIDRRY
jgi:hypothetical protein